MAESISVEHADDHGHHDHHEMSFTEKYVFPLDHKMIAMQYMFTGMFMALIGGFFAYAFRMQLAFPGMDVPFWGIVSPADYNALVTNHGTIMIFWVAMPVLIAAFGTFLIPLMCGCDDMVFPRINRLSYQVFLLSAIVLIALGVTMLLRPAAVEAVAGAIQRPARAFFALTVLTPTVFGAWIAIIAALPFADDLTAIGTFVIGAGIASALYHVALGSAAGEFGRHLSGVVMTRVARTGGVLFAALGAGDKLLDPFTEH